MKKISFLLSILISLFLLFTTVFAGDVWVEPYYRSDGTYVRGHYRSAPDGNILNNYSTKGNINLHTGKPGYVDPYKSFYRYDNPYKSKPNRYNVWDND